MKNIRDRVHHYLSLSHSLLFRFSSLSLCHIVWSLFLISLMHTREKLSCATLNFSCAKPPCRSFLSPPLTQSLFLTLCFLLSPSSPFSLCISHRRERNPLVSISVWFFGVQFGVCFSLVFWSSIWFWLPVWCLFQFGFLAFGLVSAIPKYSYTQRLSFLAI